MPKETFGRDHPFLPKADILNFEELARVARIFVGLGVEKVRLTGGEPLLRRDLPRLIEMIAGIEGLHDLTLTTNGSSLVTLARALREAGLRRATVSLDALDDKTFRAMNDVDFPVARVLKGIDAALEAGLTPLKINMVVRRGVNEHQIVPMARHFAGTGCIVRYIEYMDVGTTNGWHLEEVVSADEIVALISEALPLQPVEPLYAGEVARRYRHAGGEIGLITSVTRPFCRDCTRARVSAEGMFYTCLFASTGHDVRAMLRGGLSDEALAQALSAAWSARGDRYSELRTAETAALPKVEMSRMGG